jgi:hypothetical protein
MHTTKRRRTYRARVGGSSWSRGPSADFPTIREARAFAESYGTTADWCEITDRAGRIVASHRRDTSGDGSHWFRARPGVPMP